MKLRQHGQGWREVNEMQRGRFARECVGLACSYALVIGFIVIVVKYLAR